jgi:murein DD-endopeptidase MepM/ murein hydrolase activator NlpD
MSRAALVLVACVVPVVGACRGEPEAPAVTARGEAPVVTASVAVAPSVPASPSVPPAPGAARPPPDAEQHLAATIAPRSTLEAAVVEAAGPEVGPALSQVVHRALVWWMTPRTDLRPGDRVEAVYRLPPGQEPEVLAVWVRAQKLGRERRAARLRLPGARYPKWVQPTADGGAEELELRLVDTPITEYEQITSLIHDGRRHKGVDFKVDVGAPIVSPWAGEVVRRNWNFRGNGNSVEIVYPSKGISGYFLHLERLDPAMKVGAHVRAGQVIGTSGNTGRSTAPHLHYQLVRGKDRIVDPFDVHGHTRTTLDAAAAAQLTAELTRLSALRPPSGGRDG